MNRTVLPWIAGMLVIGTIAVGAAVAPRSPDQLKKEARHIVTGKVIGVTSETRKSRVEKAKGIHRDRVFTIKLKVTAVSKGEGLKAGAEIVVEAWQVKLRVPPLPGPQGHETIPKAGDRVTLYLKGKDGKVYRPILPNGIRVIDDNHGG